MGGSTISESDDELKTVGEWPGYNARDSGTRGVGKMPADSNWLTVFMRPSDPEEQELVGHVPGYEQEHLHMFAAVKDMFDITLNVGPKLVYPGSR
jgi:hypothetical protein